MAVVWVAWRRSQRSWKGIQEGMQDDGVSDIHFSETSNYFNFQN